MKKVVKHMVLYFDSDDISKELEIINDNFDFFDDGLGINFKDDIDVKFDHFIEFYGKEIKSFKQINENFIIEFHKGINFSFPIESIDRVEISDVLPKIDIHIVDYPINNID